MLIVLTYIDKNGTTDNWDFFSRKLYEQKGKDFKNRKSECSYGWYYYQLNEYWHFGVETIFWSILETLSSKYFQVELNVFLNEFKRTFIDALLNFNFIENETQKLKEIIEKIEDVDVWDLAKQIYESIKVSDISQCLFLGLKMLLSIYKQNENEFNGLKSFAAIYGMERDGNCIDGLKEFTSKLDDPISDVIEKFVLKNVINRHLEIAFRKMGAGIKNTLKFSYEDNFLKHVETIKPNWTTPRIYALYSFFEDLGYVTKENKISQVGKQLIKDV